MKTKAKTNHIFTRQTIKMGQGEKHTVYKECLEDFSHQNKDLVIFYKNIF